MSYDIHLLCFAAGEPHARPAGRVYELLQAAWEAPPDEHSYSRVRWKGGEADVYGVPAGADDPVDSLMFSRPAGTDGIFELMVEIAREAGMAIVLPEGKVCLVDVSVGDHLPDDTAEWPRQAVASGEELGAIVRS